MLENNLEILRQYFAKWKLKLNLRKSELIHFHLNYKQANNKLNVLFAGQIVNNQNLKHFGFTMGRTLKPCPHQRTKPLQTFVRAHTAVHIAQTN